MNLPEPMRQYRKARRPGNRAMTASERAHVDAVKRAGCVCCIAQGYPHDSDTVVEAHHLLSGGLRIGHGAVVGLCRYHHRGVKAVDGWSLPMHRRLLGPSLLHGSVPFHAHFGDDEALARMTADAVKAVQ